MRLHSSLLCVCLVCMMFASVSGRALDPTTEPLIHVSDMTYAGACRLPADGLDNQPTSAFSYSDGAIAIRPDTGSLLVTGHDFAQRVAEVSACTPSLATSVGVLPRLTVVQPLTDVLQGHLSDIAPGATDKIGSLAVFTTGQLLVNAYTYYGAPQAHSLFATGMTWTAPNPTGPVGLTNQMGDGRWTSGYVGLVPVEWQALLGGKGFAGQCCLPTIASTSFGPSLSICPDLTTAVSSGGEACTTVLGYPQSHPTLGLDTASGTLFNGATQMGGAVFVPGTRSVLFFQRMGTGPYCYGDGTGDPALAGTTAPDGSTYCYDPAGSAKGTHSYPYVKIALAYDANDLIAVKQGLKQPWEPVPYATWTLTEPFQSQTKQIGGVSFDAATSRVFLTGLYEDVATPVIRVWTIGTVSSGGGTGGQQTLTASITTKVLTCTPVIASKVYDGTTSSTIASYMTTGVISGDSATCSSGTAVFANPNVGVGRQVSVTGIQVTGSDAGNYTWNTTATVLADITAKPVTVSGLTAQNKVYDGTTTTTCSGGVLSGILPADAANVTLASVTCSFADKNVGANKPVTPSALSLTGSAAGNYMLSGGI